jgi:hypothetical protein
VTVNQEAQAMTTNPLHSHDILFSLPSCVAALRVRYEGGAGRGRIRVEFCNRRAARVAGAFALDRPRLEEAAQRLLDAWRPGWASGRSGSGSLLIDVATGETRIELDGAG